MSILWAIYHNQLPEDGAHRDGAITVNGVYYSADHKYAKMIDQAKNSHEVRRILGSIRKAQAKENKNDS